MEEFEPLPFEDAIPRLVASYYKGKPVPSIGSGISSPSIPGWNKFITNLNLALKQEKEYSSSELIALSERVVTSLQRVSNKHFLESVKAALGCNSKKFLIPRQCDMLASIP